VAMVASVNGSAVTLTQPLMRRFVVTSLGLGG